MSSVATLSSVSRPGGPIIKFKDQKESAFLCHEIRGGWLKMYSRYKLV